MIDNQKGSTAKTNQHDRIFREALSAKCRQRQETLFKGNRDVNIFKRRISEDVIYRVVALIAASLALVLIMVFLLMMLEPFSFEKILFEAISAFGTVGLSMGITANLTDLSKIIIIFLMYLGRVGPLTLIFAISEKKIVANYSYTEEKITIG